MAAIYQSDGGVVFAAANNNNAVSIPLAPTRPLGSVLLFIAFCRLITAAAPAPSGYTLLSTFTSGTASGGRVWIYAKEVVGGETNPSVTPAGVTGTSGDNWGAGIFCYSDVDLSNGIANILDGTPTMTDASGTTTCTYPALTISQVNSMLVRFLARFRDAADTFTPTATWNEREDIGTTNRTGGQFHLQDKLATASGVQATVTVAPSVTTASRYLAVTLALKALPPTRKARIYFAEFEVPEAPAGPQTRYGETSLAITVGKAVAGQHVPNYTTSIDDFNRADGLLNVGVGAGIWNLTYYNSSDPTNVRTIGNQLADGLTTWQSVRTISQIEDDCDILIDCVVAPVAPNNEFGIFFLMTDPGTPTYDSYAIFYSAGTWILRRYLNGVSQGNITTTAGSLLAGDTLWIYKRGSTIKLFKRPFGGAYTQILTATDANIAVPGVVAIELSDTTQRWDNFRGGPLVSIGPVTHYGAVSKAFIFDKAVAASRKTFSSVVMPVTFSKDVRGQRKVFSQIIHPITFSKDVRGQRKTFGQLVSPLIFSKDVRGQRKTFGQTAFPITVGIATAGFRAGLTLYGAVAFPVIFGKDVRGQRKAFGQIARPIIFTKDVRGQRKTFGQVVFPIIFTKESVGKRQAFGQLSMQTLFGKETTGRRKTFSQFAMPVIFSKVVVGSKKTFGRVILPVNATIIIDGYGWTGAQTYYGQIVRPFTFNKQISARRKTFSSTVSPFIFGKAVQGRRKTFSEFDLPIDFETLIKSGPVGAHGLVELELIFITDIAGKVMPIGIILNDALDLYLGEQNVVAVYTEDQKVWPIT